MDKLIFKWKINTMKYLRELKEFKLKHMQELKRRLA